MNQRLRQLVTHRIYLLAHAAEPLSPRITFEEFCDRIWSRDATLRNLPMTMPQYRDCLRAGWIRYRNSRNQTRSKDP